MLQTWTSWTPPILWSEIWCSSEKCNVQGCLFERYRSCYFWEECGIWVELSNSTLFSPFFNFQGAKVRPWFDRPESFFCLFNLKTFRPLESFMVWLRTHNLSRWTQFDRIRLPNHTVPLIWQILMISIEFNDLNSNGYSDIWLFINFNVDCGVQVDICSAWIPALYHDSGLELVIHNRTHVFEGFRQLI